MILSQVEAYHATGISIDSRTTKPGEIFVAIRGEHCDGHDFVANAADKQACAAIVEHKIDDIVIPQIVVESSLKALIELGNEKRQQFHKPVVALTGSCGKTTVKEMIASILREHYHPHVTRGNYNTQIGLPISLFNLNDSHDVAVFELGANRKGDIKELTAIAKPDIALITNVAPAHLEGFGSVEAIFQEKTEIFNGLNPDGTAIYNADDAHAQRWNELLKHKNTMTFAIKHPADVMAKNIQYDTFKRASFDLEKVRIALPVAGEHNILNALAAAAVAKQLGVPLEKVKTGLEKFVAVGGRMGIKQGVAGATIIDDTYNANLKSVTAAIDVLAGLKGKRVFVLGDLGELGDADIEHHQLIGQKTKQAGIDVLYTCGILSQHASDAFGDNSQHFSEQAPLISNLLSQLDHDTIVLVKGSRSAHMEHVVNALLKKE